MDAELRKKLLDITKEKITSKDSSHDFQHTYRVLLNAERISKKEGGDLEIIVPAALFHDLVVYQKDHPNRDNSQKESAEEAGKILGQIKEYPQEKIDKVKIAILECSFSRNIQPSTFESGILQDADKLESTGVISIMRTFSSTGQMQRPFYNPEDPFCEKREPDSKKYALDLFYNRLLLAKDRMNTKTAKELAQERHEALLSFLENLRRELD